MSDAARYSVAAGDPARDIADVLTVWKTLEGDASAHNARYRWLYCDNAGGASTLVLLRDNRSGQCVGTAGLAPRRMRCQGVEFDAGVLVDLVVLPDHRTLFPALMLQRHMLAAGHGTHSVLYGLPNSKSMAIVRRIGYTRVGDLVRYVRVLRHREYLGRRVPGWIAAPAGLMLDALAGARLRAPRGLRRSVTPWRGEWTTGIDTRFDALWQRARGVDVLVGVRDSRFLAWRFLAAPGQQHRVFVVSRGHGEEILGYAVCQRRAATLHICDLLVDPADADGATILLHLLAGEAFREGCAAVSFAVLGGATIKRAVRMAGMVERDRTPFYASVRERDVLALRHAEWYLTQADVDE